MKKCISSSDRLGKHGRWHAIALTFSLLIPIGVPPVLAERLDLSLQPFQEATFDDAALDPTLTDARTVDPPVLAGNEAKQAGPEPDEADVVGGDAADDAEIASDTDPFDSEMAMDSDAQETDVVADADLSDQADSADSADLEPATLGELPEPQPPQLLWRFKTLFVRKDDADNSPDTIEVLEEHLSHIPLIRTARVERHIRYFQTSKRDHFDQWLTRLNHYKPLVEKIFAQFQLPGDLVFLSLVESGFNPKAYSRARAAGPWQFMKATGKLYGLRVDEYVDERRDPIKSTIAAARYLRDLYDLFGTWPLAMAAYNAGERKIQRALRKAKAETFWEIAQTKFIRRETREYVPRFMAAAIIAKNPDQYGFEEAPADIHQFEEIVVSRPLPLRAIAAAADIPYAELHRLNPELRRDVTPPDDPAYHLKVPVGSGSTIEQALDTIKPWTPSLVATHARKGRGAHPGSYRVRMGDNLGKIAKRFRVTVEELKTRNKLAGRSIKVGDLLIVGR
jgi:peptidoglycan lytic transglycosylase D